MKPSSRNLKTLLVSCGIVLILAVQTGLCEEPWRTDFNETCARTTDAMTLSIGELTTLIERCNNLEKIISTQDETVRKVYLKRLQMCRNLYVFVLETKQNAAVQK